MNANPQTHRMGVKAFLNYTLLPPRRDATFLKAQEAIQALKDRAAWENKIAEQVANENAKRRQENPNPYL